MPLLRTLLTSILSVVAVIGLAIAGTSIAAADGTPAPVRPAAPAAEQCLAAPFSTATHRLNGSALSVALIDQFRAGRHDSCGYDRLVIHVAGKVGFVNAHYVREITSDPKGDVLTVPGQARLLIAIGNPVAHAAGSPRVGQALLPTKMFASWREFRSVIFAGSFENVTSLGLGLDEKRGFRVFVLHPSATLSLVVVDVAHH